MDKARQRRGQSCAGVSRRRACCTGGALPNPLGVLLALAAAVLSGGAAGAEEAESPTPSEALDLALDATEGVYDQFKTAQAIGRFEVSYLSGDEQQPTVQSRGRYIALFDDGKCRVDVEFEKNWRLFGARGADGRATIHLTDRNVDRAVVLTGGGNARLIQFEGGVRTESFLTDFGAACVAAGFPFRDPLILGHDDPTVQRLFEERGNKNWETVAEDGKIVVRIPNRCQVVADPVTGRHITSYDEWDATGRPTLQTRLTWKQASGVWFVSRTERIADFGRHELGYWSRAEARLLSFVPNVAIDPSLFRPEAVVEPLAPVILNPTREDASTLRSDGEAP